MILESRVRLAIVSSHPIQYNAPLFQLLSQRGDLDVKVFYSWEGIGKKQDPEFKKKINWDIQLLDGYEFCFVNNIASDPGSHHFFGLDNPEMVNEIEHWKASAVLVYGWAFKTHLNVMRYFHGKIPVYFRGDSTLITGKKFYLRFLRNVWLTWVYRYVDVAFYPGTRSKEYFMASGLSSNKLVHVPHSIDNRRFKKNHAQLEIIAKSERNKLDINENTVVFLFAGKFIEHKQPLLLLEAVKELKETNSDLNLHLILVGDGPLKTELTEKTKDLSYIHIMGFRNQSDMPLVYRLCDVYVLPSMSETWGLGVNEAMVCERPVLVSNKVGCAVDIVKTGVSGEIFRSEDINSLKREILRYSKNTSISFLMRKSSSQFAEGWAIEKSATLIGDCIIRMFQRGSCSSNDNLQ